MGCAVQIERENTTVVLEAISNGELWVWWFHLGKSGSLNDINFLDTYPLITQIPYGTMLPAFEYVLTGKKHSGLFFLVDGIYLHWARFIPKIAERAKREECVLAGAQGAL